jgi:4-alpha-glucanotransferase
LRERLGVLDHADARRARVSREQDRRALLRRLARSGTGAGVGEPTAGDLGRAVHAFLASTPCRLMGVSLDDLAGETEPVNVPGLSGDRHPSWTRRMGKTLAELRDDHDATAMLDGTRSRRRRGRKP